jgi:hypothetical protein
VQQEEAAAATTIPFDTFARQKELAELVAAWPAERLVATQQFNTTTSRAACRTGLFPQNYPVCRIFAAPLLAVTLTCRRSTGKGAIMPGRSQVATPRIWEESIFAIKSGIDCVFLTCFDSDFNFLANVFPCSEIRMHRAETLEQADFLLTVTGGTVLLTDVSFLDGFWDEAVDMLAQFHPLVAFLVIADGVDRQFVSEAPRRGACGVLWKPLDWSQVRRFIRLAHEATEERAIWQRQRLRSDRIETAVPPCATPK